MVLFYVVGLVLVAALLFGVAVALFGRGESLPPLPRDTTPTALPASGVTGADVDALLFTQVIRGYKASEVDWVLHRLGREIDQLRGELAATGAAGLAAQPPNDPAPTAPPPTAPPPVAESPTAADTPADSDPLPHGR